MPERTNNVILFVFIQWPLPYASVSSRGKEVREKGQRIMIPLLSFLALPILIYTVKAYKQFTCFKIRYSFRSIKQFGNVTKFLLGQPLGHVKGAPRKDRGHEDRLDSIFPRQNHLFQVWKWQLLLRYFIASSHSSMNFIFPKVFEKQKLH